MEVQIKADSGKIELAVRNFIEPSVRSLCSFVKLGSRSTINNPDKFIYCNSPVPIVDLSAILQTTMRIEIYVKDINGDKDVLGLSEIRDIIIKLIGSGVTIDNSYVISVNNELSRPDGAGFHFCFITLNVTIV